MDLFKQLCHPAVMHTTSTEMHYTVYSICLLIQANVWDDERLKKIQETFSNCGLLFIDEKSMTGQKTFTVVRKRLQETRPNYKDKSFGNICWGRQAAATNLGLSAIQSKCLWSQRIQHIPDFWQCHHLHRTCATAMIRPIRLQSIDDAPGWNCVYGRRLEDLKG